MRNRHPRPRAGLPDRGQNGATQTALAIDENCKPINGRPTNRRSKPNGKAEERHSGTYSRLDLAYVEGALTEALGAESHARPAWLILNTQCVAIASTLC